MVSKEKAMDDETLHLELVAKAAEVLSAVASCKPLWKRDRDNGTFGEKTFRHLTREADQRMQAATRIIVAWSKGAREFSAGDIATILAPIELPTHAHWE